VGAPSRAEPSGIPDKLYFKIGEVARIVGVEPHVLRYWEKEVPSIRPSKSGSNQRRYRRVDVEAFCEIRRLLYEERYTLAGAKRCLASLRSGNAGGPEAEAAAEPESPGVCIRWGITVNPKAQESVQKFSGVFFVVVTILAWSALFGFLRTA